MRTLTLDDLQQAIRLNEEERFREILRTHPELAGARDPDGGSPALTALYHGRSAMLSDLLRSGARLNVFEAAAAGDTASALREIAEEPERIAAYSHDGWTALHLAAFFGHAGTARALIDRGAELSALSRNHNRNQPLHAAAANSQLEACEVLLSTGADPSAPAGGGWTPLHLAAANGSRPLIRLLLAHGADAQLRKDDGMTPAETARAEGHAQVLDLLEPA